MFVTWIVAAATPRLSSQLIDLAGSVNRKKLRRNTTGPLTFATGASVLPLSFESARSRTPLLESS